MLCDEFEKVSSRVQLMQNLAKNKRSLLEKFVAWLKGLRDKFVRFFSGATAADREAARGGRYQGMLTPAQIRTFESAFGKMVRDLRDNNGKNIFKTYKDGREIRLANGVKLPGVRLMEKLSFAGIRAKNAPLETWGRARFMDEQGADRDTIFDETGWIKGKDGKWRFEIEDNLNAIDFTSIISKRRNRVSAKLGEIYDNEKLYAAYPFLRTFKIEVKDLSENGAYGLAYAYDDNPRIELDLNHIKQDVERAKSTLVHEIQHIIQAKEDFAFGGTGQVAKEVSKNAGDNIDDMSDYAAWAMLGGEQEASEAEERAREGNYSSTPTIHAEDALIISYGGKNFSAASLDDAANLRDNRRDEQLTQNITRHKDGSLTVKLKYPVGRQESQQVRIARRRREVKDIDGELVSKGDDSAYVNLLTNEDKTDIESLISEGISPNRIAQEFLVDFNEELANYSVSTPEEVKIGRLLRLKGLELYAREQSRVQDSSGGTKQIRQRSNGTGAGETSARKGTTEQNEITTTNRAERGGFSTPKFSLRNTNTPQNTTIDNVAPGSPSRFESAAQELIARVSGTKTADNVEIRQKNHKGEFGFIDRFAKSMRQVSKTFPKLKYLYDIGRAAMSKQEQLRNYFAKKVQKFHELTKNEGDLAKVSAALLEGDQQQKEFTREELVARGLSKNAIHAYVLVRTEMKRMYRLVNDALTQKRVRQATVNINDVEKFKRAHFIEDKDLIKITHEDGSDKVTLFWRGVKVFEHKEVRMRQDALDALKGDPNIRISRVTKLNKTDDVADVFSVDYTEQRKPLTNLKGYIPHFFHNFAVYEKATIDGKETLVILGSAPSMAEAVEIANKYANADPDKKLVVSPLTMDLGEQEYNNVVVGDRDYAKMIKKLQDDSLMDLEEAQAFLRNDLGVSRQSRHRFFGNTQHRKGAKGFEEDIGWILQHYFTAASRYVAMEGFKPEAISAYERFYGAFKDEPKSLEARYAKDYINMVNGTPKDVEVWLNKIIADTPILGQRLSDYFNGRPALALSGSLSWSMAVAKLGILNFSSAVLNFSQAINIATRMNSYEYFYKGLKKALHPTERDKTILRASGVLDEINQTSDTGGYTGRRDYGTKLKNIGSKLKRAGDKSMAFFTYCDTLMRKAAILGAYWQGVEKLNMASENGEKVSKAALERAKEINWDANFDYSSANTPGIINAGSVVTQQLMQFQKYPIMQFEFFYNNVVKGTAGQRAKFLLPYILLSGLAGAIPGGAIINGILSSLISWLDNDDKDFAEELQAEAMRWAGNDEGKKRLVNSLIYGVLANANIDVSQRVGLNNAFSGKVYGEAPNNTWGMLAATLGGPFGSTVQSVHREIVNNNPIETIKAVSPAAGNILQAVVGETRTTHHRVGTRYETDYDRLIHALGFRSVNESNAAFVRSYEYRESQNATERKKYLMDEYLDNPTTENYKECVAAGITKKRLKQYQEQREMDANERGFGKSKKKKQDADQTRLRRFLEDNDE